MTVRIPGADGEALSNWQYWSGGGSGCLASPHLGGYWAESALPDSPAVSSSSWAESDSPDSPCMLFAVAEPVLPDSPALRAPQLPRNLRMKLPGAASSPEPEACSSTHSPGTSSFGLCAGSSLPSAALGGGCSPSIGWSSTLDSSFASCPPIGRGGGSGPCSTLPPLAAGVAVAEAPACLPSSWRGGGCWGCAVSLGPSFPPRDRLGEGRGPWLALGCWALEAAC